MSIADKLTQIANKQQDVYDAGYSVGEFDGHAFGYNEGYTKGFADGQAGGGAFAGLPTYETDVTYASTTSKITLTHNLNTQKFLLIGRVKEHDGTDLTTYRLSQVIAWSPYAFFQNAEFMLANGGTYNPYKYWVEGNVANTSCINVVGSGNATATVPQTTGVNRTLSAMLTATDNDFTIAPNNYLLCGATWHFTVIDVSSIM